MHTNTPTHKHIHTEKSTQRYTCSRKKKIEIHKHTHTNKPKHTNNKETDRCLSERSVFNRCLTRTIRAHGSCLIKASGSRLIGACGYGSCLIGARQIDACGSVQLWIDAVDQSCGSVMWIGAAVDQCFWSELWIRVVDQCLWPELWIGASNKSWGSVLLTGACDQEGERWVWTTER